jgi:MFS family permease
VLVLVLQEAGHGGTAVSALWVAASLPLAVLAPIAGRIADRFDSRTILIVAGLAQALVCLTLATVGTDSPALVVGLVAVLACGLAIVQPTMSALVPAMVRTDDLAKASGLVQTAGTVGMMIAPALAGILYGQTGARLPLLLDAASYLSLVVAGLALRTRRQPRAAGDAAGTKAHYRLRDDRTLTVVTGATAATIAALSGVNVFAVFLIRETLGASATVYGLVEASWTAGMLIGTVLVARVPRHRMTVRWVLATLAASGALVAAAAAAPSAGWLIPIWTLGGITNGVANVMLMVLVASRAPAAALGRAYATMGSAIQAAQMIGLLAAGPLTNGFEPRGLVATTGAASVVVALACLVVARRWPETPPAAVDQSTARDSVGG